MSLRAYFTLPLAAGLVALLLAGGCGPQVARCLASNCNGCCDSTGACQTGSSPTACGANGLTCVACSAAQVCQAGVCSGGVSDGGSCGPANCAGCCDANSNCQGGSDNTNCGSAGGGCQACGNAQSCNALGVCQSNGTCHGCIDRNGDCQPGNLNSACGPVGGTCLACGGGRTCQSGFCLAPRDGGGCDPTSCVGCCSSTTCIALAVEGDTQCGRGGAACISCPGGQSCTAGSCQQTVTDGGADGGTCGPANCTGCCNGTACVAVANETNSQCGSRGSACAACTGTNTCQGGVCTSTATCGPGNCAGCCNGNTCVAVGSESNAQCGAAGVACAACTGTTTCQSGSCQASTCSAANCATGCCNGNTCVSVANQSNAVCGTNGAVCAACTGTTACQSGVCITPCGPSNCGGCCNGNTCVAIANQTNAQCGTAGAACVPCGGATSCLSGVCTAAGCGPGTCAGCCNGNTCVTLTTWPPPNESDSECGAGGVACTDCIQSGKYCGLGYSQCVVPGSGGLGAPCTADSQCELGGNTNDPWCINWQGGYCDDICDSKGRFTYVCGGANYCIGILGSLGGGDFEGVCLLGCFFDTDCPAYPNDICDLTVGDGLGYCTPKCSTAAQCQSWFNDPSASCNPSSGQCCGVANFACCAGVASGSPCNDGTTCQTNGQCR